MSLATLQDRFFALVTADEAASPDALFVSTPELDARSRLHVYAEMFLWRQVDALREDFPALCAVLGEEAFAALVERYLGEHPSRHPSLAKLGEHLAAFIAGSRAPRPDLSDLARLEWARAEVFEETTATTLGPALLATCLPHHSLQLVPALRLLWLDHDAVAVWKKPQAPRPARTPVVVWRRDFDVFHAPVDPDEAKAIERAAAGAPMHEICGAFEGRPDALAAATRAIGSWFTEGWIAELHAVEER